MLPVLGDVNGLGIDPDRFVNIRDLCLERLDCQRFVRDLEREDIHAVFCGGKEVGPFYLSGLEIQLVGFVAGYRYGVTVGRYPCRIAVGICDGKGRVVEVLLKVRSGVLIDIDAQGCVGCLVTRNGIGRVEIGDTERCCTIVPGPGREDVLLVQSAGYVMFTPYGRDALSVFGLAGCVEQPAKSTNTATSTTIAMLMQG